MAIGCKNVPPHRQSFRLKALAFSVAMACSSSAIANPTGAQVVHGSADIVASGNTLTITNSAGAIINWQSFSIGSHEVTRFIQPSADSSVLNRVVTNNPSELLGQLTSNGRVFLINPAGILVGAGARIDTAGLVASTLNLSNSDFLAGRLNFVGEGGAGNVVNRGEIVTPAGGSVYLVGTNVTNEGVIRTPGGEALLAAGQSVRLLDTATPGVSVEITGSSGQATNLNEISAEAGRVGIAGALVRQAGGISASSVVREGGRVFLKASGRAEVDGGKIEVTSGAGKGGRIEITGQEVVLKGEALLDASGATGGGQIFVGGGYQGKETGLVNAQASRVDSDVVLKADALDKGDGGLIVAWADGRTEAHGKFSAQGGANGGNGGLIETSGKEHLSVSGVRVSTRAPTGKTGTWLLDPDSIYIHYIEDTGFSLGANDSAILDTDLSSNLELTDVVVQADYDITVRNGAVVTGPASSTQARTLTLKAGRDIVLEGGSYIDADNSSAPLNVTLHANSTGNGGSISLGDGTTGGFISSNGGNILLGGGVDLSTGYATGMAAKPFGISISKYDLYADGGNITLRGKGADGANNAVGVGISDSYLNTYGMGGISLFGIGGGGTSVSGNDGIRLAAEQIYAAGGAINLQGTAGTGGFAISQLYTSSWGSIHSASGSISLNAVSGDVQLAGGISADGNIAPVAPEDVDAGSVSITVANGNLLIGANGEVSAQGADTGGSTPAGRGGSINLSVPNGAITIGGVVSANGGYTYSNGASPNGGLGGTVMVSGKDIAISGIIEADGGDAYAYDPATYAGGRGGAGGSVQLTATAGNLNLAPGAYITAWGGDGADFGAHPSGAGIAGGAGGQGGVAVLSASGALTIQSGATIDVEGGWGGDGNNGAVSLRPDGAAGGDGGAGGLISLTAGSGGVANHGGLTALGGDAGYGGTGDGGANGADGLAGASGTVAFHTTLGGNVTQSSTGYLFGHLKLGDSNGAISGNVNFLDSYGDIDSWDGIINGAAVLESDGAVLIGASGLKAASIKLTAASIAAASQGVTAFDTSGNNGTIWLALTDPSQDLGSSLQPLRMKSGTGMVKLDVAGSFAIRFDEALTSSRLSLCEPSCGPVSGGRDIHISTATGFDITIVPETMAGVVQPYSVDGDNINLNSGGNIVFSGAQAGFTDAGSVSLTAAGGIYAPGVIKAIDTSASGGSINLLAREIAGPNEGLTINPGTGTVSAWATSGGMHLAQVSGNLSTSRYVLRNDAVGSNTHLTALAGNILVDGVSGFHASTQDDGLHLFAPLGSVQQSAGAPLVANGLFARAQSGIALTDTGNRFGEFTALNTGSGDIRLVNAGNPLVLGGDSVTGLANLKNLGGNIFIDNMGAIISDGAIEASGTVDLIAHSPITLNAPVTAYGLVLTAMSSAAGNDDLTFNSTVNAGLGGVNATAGRTILVASTGSLQTTGTATLTAGQSVVRDGSISAAGGVTYSAPLVSGGAAPVTQQMQQQVVSSTTSTTTTSTTTDSSTTQVVTSPSTTTSTNSSLTTGATIGGGDGEFGGTNTTTSSSSSTPSSSETQQAADAEEKQERQASGNSNQKQESKNAPKKNAQCTS